MHGKCRGQHGECDVCDGMKSDPNTGWGGFTDHYAKKGFNTNKEQADYYRKARDRGETGERDSWGDDF